MCFVAGGGVSVVVLGCAVAAIVGSFFLGCRIGSFRLDGTLVERGGEQQGI